MNRLLIMLADFDPDNPMAGQRGITDPRLYPMLALLGALAISVVIATIWAVRYARKEKGRKHRHHHHSSTRKGSTNAAERVEPAADKKSKKKWRRPRRPHRPLNPTLAQVGGLPPIRDENTPLPPMP